MLLDEVMLRIDAHVHFAATAPEDQTLFDELNLKSLNICLAPLEPTRWRETQRADYQGLASRRPQRWGWCTSFLSPTGSKPDPNYADQVIAQLQTDFADGAVAVKIWKNVGMEDRTADGDYLQIDDKAFDPIFAWLAREGRTVLTHIAEPMACWQPLDPASPHFRYYSTNPQWHMHGRAGFPSHELIIAARDRVISRHPTLRVVGAHFGSMEYDLDEVSKRLDQFPNFAVDTSARLEDLAMHGRSKVTGFLEKYADRILWGSDQFVPRPAASQTADERRAVWDEVRQTYAAELNYYTGDGPVRIGERVYAGLNLPESIQTKLFFQAAKNWYPGL